MIELRHQAGYAYPPSIVFAALADVVEYPAWQSDVQAACVRGGGPARPGADVSVVRKVLGRSDFFGLRVAEYEQDNALTLWPVTGAAPRLGHEFRLSPLA